MNRPARAHRGFRRVSGSRVLAYGTLDADTRNCTSFFIVRHGGQAQDRAQDRRRLPEKGCVTHEAATVACEAEGYYRFADFQAGQERIHRAHLSGDTLVMEVHTSRFGAVSPPQIPISEIRIHLRGSLRLTPNRSSRPFPSRARLTPRASELDGHVFALAVLPDGKVIVLLAIPQSGDTRGMTWRPFRR
jgi:hypothetical protein